MNMPIGIVAKNLSIDIERIFRKVDDKSYAFTSDDLRYNLYQILIKNLEQMEPKLDKDKIEQFTIKYKDLVGKTIDEILELKDGINKMEELKNELNIIISN